MWVSLAALLAPRVRRRRGLAPGSAGVRTVDGATARTTGDGRHRSGMERAPARCAAQIGIQRPVRLLRSLDRSMPMAFGVRQPAILIPSVADTWSDDRRRAVLLHELAHIARRDCLTQLMAAVACALYWIHPGVWWIARRLRVERELACDDLVLKAGTHAREYAEHLLELAYTLGSYRAPALVVSMARPRQVEGRMLAVLDAARNRTAPALRQPAGGRRDRRRAAGSARHGTGRDRFRESGPWQKDQKDVAGAARRRREGCAWHVGDSSDREVAGRAPEAQRERGLLARFHDSRRPAAGARAFAAVRPRRRRRRSSSAAMRARSRSKGCSSPASARGRTRSLRARAFRTNSSNGDLRGPRPPTSTCSRGRATPCLTKSTSYCSGRQFGKAPGEASPSGSTKAAVRALATASAARACGIWPARAGRITRSSMVR